MPCRQPRHREGPCPDRPRQAAGRRFRCVHPHRAGLYAESVPHVPSLVASGLTVTFGDHRALDGVDLRVAPGLVTALLGPNGAGKTTFLRCCTGLVRACGGTLSVLGAEPGRTTARSRIGFMPQSTGAWSAVTPKHLLGYLASLYDNPQPVADLMRALAIDDFAATPYRRLSGGQQQAVNLAGALVGRPELLFLDEPTAGLDVRARRRTWDLVRAARDAGVAVLLTTHDMDEAATLSDDVAIIDRGRITAKGTVAELTREASLEEVFLANTSGDAT